MQPDDIRSSNNPINDPLNDEYVQPIEPVAEVSNNQDSVNESTSTKPEQQSEGNPTSVVSPTNETTDLQNNKYDQALPVSPNLGQPILQNPVPSEPVINEQIPNNQPATQSQSDVLDGVVPTTNEKENIYTEICSQIIKEQEKIIGALAIEQANQVTGLTVDPATYHCTVSGDGSVVIDDLIEQYRDFFGHAAVEVCKEAASRFISKLPTEELPSSLR